MRIRYPAPLVFGDRIGVTCPSSGVGPEFAARLEYAVRVVRQQGYEVVVGACMDGSSHVSAPAAERAAELMWMLTDPTIRAVVPPWGGETAIDLLPLLDFDAIAAAEPTWVVGYSDIATVITPMTLLTGVATLHGNNLMDTPYRAPKPLLTWLDITRMAGGASFTQSSPGHYRSTGIVDYRQYPQIRDLTLDAPTSWRRIDSGGTTPEPVEVTGRLVGGCIETMCNLAGTPYGDMASFARRYAPEGVIVYVEAAADNALSICRYLHGMRLAGFFTGANAVLVGRTSAPWAPTLSQHEAVCDALGPLGIPIIADVECGHVAPFLPIVNGALGHLRFGTVDEGLTQTLT